MEHPPPYQVRSRGRRSAQPQRLAAYARCLAQHALPVGELKAVEAVRRLASAAVGHVTLSPAEALVLAADELLALPDLDVAAALLEEAAMSWLAGRGPSKADHAARGLEGVILIRDLQPGQRVGVTRTGPSFVVAHVDRDGPLTTVTTADGRQLPFTASTWLIDRTQG